MIFTRDHKTLDIFDPFPWLGPKRRELINNSWAKLFREQILTELPIRHVADAYHQVTGRPTKELYAMLGLMILQQMNDLTDDEAVYQYAFNIQWHYALDIKGESDTETYVSLKTLWTMRRLLSERGLYHEIFAAVAEKLAAVFKVDMSRQRLDSTHLFSNMRHLGRIGLFASTIRKFLVNLKRHHRELFNALDEQRFGRYLSQGDGVFSLVKPSESARTLQEMGNDLFFLVERFKDHELIREMSTYQLLVRLLREQCLVRTEELGGPRVEIKPNKDVPSDSLQNPSDPDAGYSGHKGKGYQVQVMETYTPQEEPGLSLITHVAVEPAHVSDAHALVPAIEAAQERGLGPEQLVADSLYGSDENCREAEARGVEVVAPVMAKAKNDNLCLEDFVIDQDGAVTACPQGHPAQRTAQGKRYRAYFAAKTCKACSARPRCPVRQGSRRCTLYYKEKDLRLARRRAKEKTAEFQDKYRYRAGIEAGISHYKAQTGVGQLRVRGLPAVSFCAFLKAAAVNILRATAFLRLSADKRTSLGSKIPAYVAHRIVLSALKSLYALKNALHIGDKLTAATLPMSA